MDDDMIAELPKRKDTRAFAEAIKKGETMQSAMLKAGYSPKVARQGKAGLSQSMIGALLKEGIKLGESVSAEEQEKLIRGKLLENALMGNDKAVQSLKLLGQDKRVSMFTADNLIQAVIIQAPERVMPTALPAEPETKLLEE